MDKKFLPSMELNPPAAATEAAITDHHRQGSSSLDSLCYNITSLQQLARQGSWRSVLDVIAQARKLSLPHFPHEQLVYHTYLVLAHMKLRDYGAAATELDSITDLDSPKYQYQFYPSLYPGRSGSMAPFALRWIHAQLPHRLGQTPITIERLYALFDHCQQRINRLLRETSSNAGVAGKKEHGAKEAPTSDEQDHYSSMPLMQLGNDLSNAFDATHELDTKTESKVDTQSDPQPQLEDVQNSNAGLPIDEQDQHDKPERAADSSDVVSSVNAAANDLQNLKVTDDCLQTPGVSVGDLNTQLATGALQRWQHRQEVVINSIMCHHLNQHDFILVLKWLKELLEKHPADPWMMSKLGYVQMQYGDLGGAKATFLNVEEIISKMAVGNPMHTSNLKALVSRNRGLLLVVGKQYSDAIKEFDAAIALNPIDIVSANNKALCYMYSRDLIGSTKALESILDKAPLAALNESLVLNLCSMYELAFVNNVQTKKTLSDWILQVAPDDFDLSCTRL